MSREVRLAEIIIKFEKGVKEHPIVDKGFPVIGYHCKMLYEHHSSYDTDFCKYRFNRSV